MLINNVSAFRLAEDGTRELVSFYRPAPSRRFAKFELPAALPVISSGIKVSVTLSVIGAVVGEFVSGATGLGSLVSRAKASFDVELMFVALLWLVALGLGYFGAAHLVFALGQRRRHKSVVSRGDTAT
jgi:ABC-type nitrate/sulfonate/bicarbonate transport system permease component